MTSVTKIYLDMDGVLCNFDKRWIELFNETPSQTRSRKEFVPNWDTFVLNENFVTLDDFPGSDDLLEFVMSKSDTVDIEILSSSGGQKYHNEVRDQKLRYLKARGLNFTTNIVPGRKLKQNYATPDSILIDDTEDVIEAFNRAGGIGILHTDAKVTLAKLREIFSNE
jgi:hypothetical protein